MCSQYCYVESPIPNCRKIILMLTFFSCDSMDFNFCSSIIILLSNKCVCSLYREGERGPHNDSFNFTPHVFLSSLPVTTTPFSNQFPMKLITTAELITLSCHGRETVQFWVFSE